MNSNNKLIFEAIDIIMNKREQQLDYDSTQEANIINAINPDNGTYWIRYNGNQLRAFALDATVIYKENDRIQIKIKNNRLEDGITILKKVNSDSLKGQEIDKMSKTFIPFGPDWFPTFYKISEEAENVILTPSSEHKDIFKHYSNNCDYIKLSAEFKATLLKDNYDFNYGIQLIFLLEDNSTVDYYLDSSTFQGNKYSSTWKRQEIDLNIPKNVVLQEINIYHDDNFETQVETKKGEKIEVQNINICFLKEINYLGNTYYLDVRAPQGTYFKSKDEIPLELTANLIYGSSQSKVPTSSYKVNWYKQKGLSWELLENEKSTILKVYPKDIDIKNNFKIEIILNNGTILDKEIEVFDWSDETLELVLEDKILKIVNNNENYDYKGIWEIEFYDSVETLKEKSNSLDISKYIGYDWVKIYCHNLENENQIRNTTLTYELVAASTPNDLKVEFNEGHKYTYDEKGSMDFSACELYKLLSFKTNWAKGTINRILDVKWSVGNEFIENSLNSTFTPLNSMLQNIWVDDEYQVHYQIRNFYSDTRDNNTFKLWIKLVNGKEYTFEKKIEFTKIGEVSSTSDEWTCVIRPVNPAAADYQPLPNDVFLAPGTDLYLGIFAYNKGTLINPRGLKYIWTKANNVTITNTENDYIKKVNRTNTSNEIPIVQCKVLVNDTQYVYANYGINYTNNQIDELKFSSNIPKEVKFENGYASAILEATINGEKATLDLITAPKEVNLSNNNKIVIDSSYNGTTGNAFTLQILGGKTVLYYPVLINFKPISNNVEGWEGSSVQVNDTTSITGSVVGSGSSTPVSKKTSINYNKYIEELKEIAEDKNWLEQQYFAGLMSKKKYDKEYAELLQKEEEVYKKVEKEQSVELNSTSTQKESAATSNNYTGILMGNKTEVDTTSQYGLYGYSNGKQTVAITEDGSATFGSNGQIKIDGNDASIAGTGTIIYEKQIVVSKITGEEVDVDKIVWPVKYAAEEDSEDGSATTKLTPDDWFNTFYEIQTDNTATKSVQLALNLAPQEEVGTYKAIEIGDNFSVDYKGNLNSTAGFIGGWNIKKDSLQSLDQSTKLTSEQGIYTEALTLIDDKQVTKTTVINEAAYPVLGRIGKILGSSSGTATTTIGIDTRKESIKTALQAAGYSQQPLQQQETYSIVLESGQHIRISVEDKVNGHFYLDCKPENQHGIYARFA